ncbi:unnamed protein product [Notodromas monacha]|uniref:Uncharacterized protein n=1 Tax=Notodromas monacha TaxID=399045 RepID=A0A7R9GG90_9CRUS|nr:unnamed protein product [Notodromas monacha]CAG0919957.1 unnamed protein product [Notodromas monacha]
MIACSNVCPSMSKWSRFVVEARMSSYLACSFILVVVTLFPGVVHGQLNPLHVRGFSGSLFDRIATHLSPNLGVDPQIFGIKTSTTPNPLIQLLANVRLNQNGGFNPSVQTNRITQSELEKRQQLSNLIISFQREQELLQNNPQAMLRTQIQQLLSQTANMNNGQSQNDPAARLLPYFTFLNNAARNPAVAEVLRKQLLQRSFTTTTTTTPKPQLVDLSQLRFLLQNAPGNPELLQQFLAIAAQRQGISFPGIPSTEPTTTTTTTTTPVPTTTTEMTTTTTTTTTPAPSLLVQTLGGNVNNAVFTEFLKFLTSKRGSSVQNLPIATLAPSSTTSTTVPPEPVTTTTLRPTISIPQPTEPDAERFLLKQVLSKVLSSLREEKPTLPPTIITTESVPLTTSRPVTEPIAVVTSPISTTTSDPENLFKQLLALSGITESVNGKIVEPLPIATRVADTTLPVKVTSPTSAVTTGIPSDATTLQEQAQFWNREFRELQKMQQRMQHEQLLKQFDAQRQQLFGVQTTTQLPSSWTETNLPIVTETPFLTTTSRNFDTTQVTSVGNEQGFQVQATNAVQDTPEVAAAKEAHFREVAKVRADQARRQALKELILATTGAKP